ncbi:hypothetical protein C8A00DRAFT_18972, partial [Chaetomidium leptoderma]
MAGLDASEILANLMSDLGPLLALFGGPVIQQFLSTSLGWADNILLATGPIGIITIIVSAIRISGSKPEKVLIGRYARVAPMRFRTHPSQFIVITLCRAREERSSAEKELLSSTSDEVCELWTGQEIVRTKGQRPAGMGTLVITKHGHVMSIAAALERGCFSFEEQAEEAHKDVSDAAPNLTLNFTGSKNLTRDTWILAAISLAVQIVAVVVTGVREWHPDDTASHDSQPSLYGFPCYLVGTVSLFLGILGCGRVIEAATTELKLRPSAEQRNEVAVVRLQQSCTVGDQRFQSFAIFNPFNNPNIHISRWARDGGEYRYGRSGTVSSQALFFGLQTLHWSSTLGHLLVIVVVTALRAVARIHLVLVPPNFRIPKTDEIAWLAL